MGKIPIPDEETRKEIREFFGVTDYHPKPIPSNTFKTLVQILKYLPDQHNNPFAKYLNDPEYSTIGKDVVRANSGPQRKKEASHVSIHPSAVDVGGSSINKERKSDGTSSALCKDGVLSGPATVIDEPGMSKNSELMDTIAYGEEGTNVEAVGFCNVHEDLSNIQRILMDESDDMDTLQVLDKDLNLDLVRDLGSILEMDRSGDKSLTMERIASEKLTAGEITKEDVMDKKKRKGIVVNKIISEGGVGVSQAQNRNVFVASASEKLTAGKITKEVVVDKEKRKNTVVNKIISEVGVGDSQAQNRKALAASAKGKKLKAKNTQKMSENDVNAGKHKRVCVEGEANISIRCGRDDPLVLGKTPKQNALGISMDSLKEDKESWPKSCEVLRYTREQLLYLGKTTFVPDYIKKVVQEIGAKIHEKHQIAAAFKIADTEINGILKNKKRGSSSEARKEKKKLKRRKQRAETNKELGVRRLKLQPNVKPKVVQHCRHYLNGRCHEGEKCKFSHDVVPLTKSKPCCHFARQSCMKADDCPFDHDLSKYPCNNFLDTGFCGRRESCLFSHKIQAKEGSKPSSVTLKCDTNSADQPDTSKAKQHVNAGIPFIFGKSSPSNLKKTLATQNSQPATKPKGLSFLTFRSSQLDYSVQPKESGLSQQSSYTVGYNQPNMVAAQASGIKKTINNIPNSDTQQGANTLLNDSAKIQLKGTFGTNYAVGNLTPNLPDRALNLPGMVKSGISDFSVRSQQKGTLGRSYAVGTSASKAHHPFEGFMTPTPSPKRVPNDSEKCEGASTPESAFLYAELSKDIPTLTPCPSRALNHSEMSKGAPTPEKDKETNVSPSYGTSYDTPGGKTARVSSTKEDTWLGEGGKIKASEKLKELQPETGFWGSQTSLSQFSTKVDVPVKNLTNNRPKALQSALAFAEKYQSGIKLNSLSATKKNKLNEGGSCSGSRQSEVVQASKVLQFLNHQGEKEKR